jgi:hypothetical protein
MYHSFPTFRADTVATLTHIMSSFLLHHYF